MGKVWEIFSSPALCARHLMLRLEGSVSGVLRGRLSSSCGFFPGQSTVEDAFLIPVILLMMMLLIQPGILLITAWLCNLPLRRVAVLSPRAHRATRPMPMRGM